jgi:hypothetical protein
VTTWRTMFEEVLANTGRPNNASEVVRAKLAIVSAIKQHVGEGFSFNETSFEFDTVSGQVFYGEADAGVPRGMFELVGALRLYVAGDTSSIVALPRKSLQEFRGLQVGHAGGGQPECFTVWAGRIALFPTPDATVHTIAGDSHALDGAGLIISRHDGTAFKFYKPGTTSFVVGNEVVDAYPDPGAGEVNAWFGEGYDMVRCYAEYILYAQVYHAKDRRADAALTRYLEAKSALEQRSTRLAMPRQIDAYELS